MIAISGSFAALSYSKISILAVFSLIFAKILKNGKNEAKTAKIDILDKDNAENEAEMAFIMLQEYSGPFFKISKNFTQRVPPLVFSGFSQTLISPTPVSLKDILKNKANMEVWGKCLFAIPRWY